MTVDAEPTSTIDHLAELARVLTPASPPRIIEDVYTDDQHARILDVIRREGPWPSIIAHHFETVDEVIATTVGALVGDHGLTLDDIATAQFRGFLAENSVSYHPELDDIVYNRRFLDLAIDYWDATYAKPTLVLFNLCGPHESIPVPHLDGVTFRGVRI